MARTTATPKTRMTIEDRRAICTALLAHKFTRIYDGLRARENAAAVAAWNTVHAPYIAMMSQMPEGAFRTDTSIAVNAGGYSLNLRYGGGSRGGWRRSVGEDDHGGEAVSMREFCEYTVNLTDETLIDEIKDIVAQQRATDTERSTLDVELTSTLQKFQSFEALEEAWPEIETFTRARMKERGLYAKPNLPAVLLFDLTRKLDLPPEEVDEPEVAEEPEPA